MNQIVLSFTTRSGPLKVQLWTEMAWGMAAAEGLAFAYWAVNALLRPHRPLPARGGERTLASVILPKRWRTYTTHLVVSALAVLNACVLTPYWLWATVAVY